MKKFFSTIKNIFSIEELRMRIIMTLLFLVVFRLGSFIVLPGIDPSTIKSDGTNEGLLGIINVFSGGAFNNVSVLANLQYCADENQVMIGNNIFDSKNILT